MGLSIAIAWRDFRSGLTTPRIAVVCFFFLFLMGFFFYSFVDAYIGLGMQAANLGNTPPSMNQLLKALFYNLHFLVTLLIPAVTMGSFSSEFETGTLKNLLSSPVPIGYLVLGKLLSCLWLIAVIFFLSGVFPLFLAMHGSPDLGVILSSYIGLFLLAAFQVAFGVWISSMCQSQFVSFIFILLGLFSMLVLDVLSTTLQSEHLAMRFLEYFSVTRHLDSFLKGSLSVSDISFFLGGGMFFFYLTILAVDSRRWR